MAAFVRDEAEVAMELEVVEPDASAAEVYAEALERHRALGDALFGDGGAAVY